MSADQNPNQQPANASNPVDPAAVIMASLRFLRNEWLPLLLVALPAVAIKTWLAWDMEQTWQQAMFALGDAAEGAAVTLTQAQANALGAAVAPRFLQFVFMDTLVLALVLAYLSQRSNAGADARRSPMQTWAAGLGLLPMVLLTRLLTATLLFAGLLAFVLPGLVVWVRLSLALPVLAINRCSPLQAVLTSVRLTGPRFWPILTVMAALFSAFWAATQVVNLGFLQGSLSAPVALSLRVVLEFLDLVFVIALFRIAMLLLPPKAA